MLVTARVRSCTTGGMVVSFLTFFSGTVDVFHLQQASLLHSSALPLVQLR